MNTLRAQGGAEGGAGRDRRRVAPCGTTVPVGSPGWRGWLGGVPPSTCLPPRTPGSSRLMRCGSSATHGPRSHRPRLLVRSTGRPVRARFNTSVAAKQTVSGSGHRRTTEHGADPDGPDPQAVGALVGDGGSALGRLERTRELDAVLGEADESPVAAGGSRTERGSLGDASGRTRAPSRGGASRRARTGADEMEIRRGGVGGSAVGPDVQGGSVDATFRLP
jgi:hypothetical protein